MHLQSYLSMQPDNCNVKLSLPQNQGVLSIKLILKTGINHINYKLPETAYFNENEER